eukprot:270374-Prymnesium_polylepis.1
MPGDDSYPILACVWRAVRYSKKDVLELKSVFDGYDESKDGKVSLKEFSAQLNRNKKQVAVGVKSTREERRAAEGISLAGRARALLLNAESSQATGRRAPLGRVRAHCASIAARART